MATVDDVMPGKRLGRKSLKLDPEHVSQYLAATQGDPALYAEASVETGLAPLALLATEPWGWPGAYVEYWRGGVASSMSWASAGGLAHVGQTVGVEACVSDRYVRRERETSVVEVVIAGPDGGALWKGAGAYSAKVNPEAVRRDVERREAAPLDTEVAAGPDINMGSVVFTREMSQLYWAHRTDLGTGNFHVNQEAAARIGLPDVMIGSSQLLGWCSERFMGLHGRRWLVTGAIQVTFRAPVVAGDGIQAKLRPVAPSPGSDRLRFNFELQKPGGVTVLTGVAEVNP